LHRALKWFKTYSKINWVESHQDNKVYKLRDIPLDAYLNSEADKLATTGLKRLQENLSYQWTQIQSFNSA
jgi:hypothetical protein